MIESKDQNFDLQQLKIYIYSDCYDIFNKKSSEKI